MEITRNTQPLAVRLHFLTLELVDPYGSAYRIGRSRIAVNFGFVRNEVFRKVCKRTVAINKFVSNVSFCSGLFADRIGQCCPHHILTQYYWALLLLVSSMASVFIGRLGSTELNVEGQELLAKAHPLELSLLKWSQCDSRSANEQ